MVQACGGRRFGDWLKACGLPVSLLLWQGFALAQQAVPNDEGKAWLACMTRPQQAPEYPERDRSTHLSGLMRLQLRFTAPDKPPEIEVLYRAGSDDMVDSARSHVEAYRLPCLPPGHRLDVVQEFVFTARAGAPTAWYRAAEAVPVAPKSDWRSCLRSPPEALRIDEDMRTGSAIKRSDHGNVLVRLRFEHPDQPPRTEVLYSKADSHVRQAILDHLAKYRAPCLQPGSGPLVLQQQFSFHSSYADKARYKFNDMGLLPFLRSMKNLEQRPVSFDLDTMACPFQVVWGLGQPALPNSVGEIGPRNLNRVGFLAWLSELTMDLTPQLFEQLLGQEMVVTVPCGKVELGQKAAAG